MTVTLLHDIIVNDGKKGIARKKGDVVEVPKGDANLLIINKQASEGAQSKKG